MKASSEGGGILDSTRLRAKENSGPAVTVCEELFSHRRSQPGPRAKGENRAVQEFPVFMAIRCEKR